MVNQSFFSRCSFVEQKRFEKNYKTDNFNRVLWSLFALAKLISERDIGFRFSPVLIIAILHLGLSVIFVLCPRMGENIFRFYPLLLTFGDIGYLTYVIYFTGLDNSYMYLFYFFTISFGGLSYGLRGALLVSLVAACCYYGINFIALDSVPFKIPMRIVFLIYFSLYMGFLYERSQNKIYNLAVHDGLTSLYNQKYFFEVLDKTILDAEKYDKVVSLALLDIDNFKEYNDSFGHLKGDKLLKDVSLLMKSNIRSTDIAARYGGDEFVIIFPNTSLDLAMMVSERIRASIKKDTVTQKNIPLSVSIGVAIFPEDGQTAEELFDAADKSLYNAKKQGKNRVMNLPRTIEI